MSGIVLSKAVRSNLLNLQHTAGLLSKAQDRISSGLSVDSALDNPTNFFTAQGLTARANDLAQLSDAVSNAVQTVAAADKGLSAISKLVVSAQATARQALQTAATVDETTTVGPVTEHLATLTGAVFTAPGADGNLTINGVDVGLHTVDDVTWAVQHINDEAIPGISASAGAGADAGKVVLTAAAGTSITIGSTLGGFTSGQSDTYIAASPGSTSTTSVANPKRAELVDTYNDLLGQIDDLARDSGFNGVNLLDGDNLSVLFNEDGTSRLSISGVNDTATGLGLSALASIAFDTNSSINDTLDDLKASLDTLRTQSSLLGSKLSVVETRQQFTAGMIDVLTKGASNLTVSDSNVEAADVLALQTRQQLASTALSLASQADQNVLRLF